MMTLLFPTDFSKNAENAFRYALALAPKMKAGILLVHAFDSTQMIPYTSGLVIAREIELIEQQAVTKLKSVCARAQQEGVPCEYLCLPGSLTSVVFHIIRDKNPGLIVMGTQGASGIREVIVGSNTASVMERANCPVLAVPEHSVFHGIHRITCATGCHERDLEVLSKLVGIAKEVDAKITLLHVSEKELYREDEEEALKQFKDHVIQKTGYEKFACSLVFGKDLSSVVERYLEEEAPDLFAFSEVQRSRIEQLFTSGLTRRMAFHAHIPILAFHTKKETPFVTG